MLDVGLFDEDLSRLETQVLDLRLGYRLTTLQLGDLPDEVDTGRQVSASEAETEHGLPGRALTCPDRTASCDVALGSPTSPPLRMRDASSCLDLPLTPLGLLNRRNTLRPASSWPLSSKFVAVMMMMMMINVPEFGSV